MFLCEKIENYNPKAKQAFGQSLVDIGNTIYKNLITIILISPIMWILDTTFNNSQISLNNINTNSNIMYIASFLYIVAIFTAEIFRNKGLYYINQAELDEKA